MEAWTSSIFSAQIPQPQIDESTLIAVQQHMAQQAAFQQIPDAVKSVRLLPSDLRGARLNSVSF